MRCLLSLRVIPLHLAYAQLSERLQRIFGSTPRKARQPQRTDSNIYINFRICCDRLRLNGARSGASAPDLQPKPCTLKQSKLAHGVRHRAPNHSLPSWASCASIVALSPLRIRSNSGGQMPVTNSRSASGTPASVSTNRQVACASKWLQWCAFSPVAAYRVRTSFSRRTLFSMYESNGFIGITC